MKCVCLKRMERGDGPCAACLKEYVEESLKRDPLAFTDEEKEAFKSIIKRKLDEDSRYYRLPLKIEADDADK